MMDPRKLSCLAVVFYICFLIFVLFKHYWNPIIWEQLFFVFSWIQQMTDDNFIIKINLYKFFFFFFIFSRFSIHTLSPTALSSPSLRSPLSFTCFLAEPKQGSCRGRSNWFKSCRGRSEYLGLRWLRQGCGLLVSQWDRSEFGRGGESWVAKVLGLLFCDGRGGESRIVVGLVRFAMGYGYGFGFPLLWFVELLGYG